MRIAWYFYLLLASTVNLCGLSVSQGQGGTFESRGEVQGKLLGAEIELSDRHLLAFASDIDFEDLEKRFLEGKVFGKYVDSHPTDIADLTLNLPIQVRNFFELIPKQLSELLVKDLPEEFVRNLLIVPERAIYGANQGVFASDQRITVPDQKLGRPKEVTNNPNEAILGSENKIFLEQHVAIRSSWQTINSKWNKLPSGVRLRSIPWSQLPLKSQSKLLVLLYALHTSKDYGPGAENFEANVLGLKFRTPHVAELFNKFYGAKDDFGIVEFHTLDPKRIDPFFAELKELLVFLGVAPRVLFPGTTYRNDIGLHIHFSAPNLTSSTIEKFAANFKRMMVFRALAAGDYSVLVPPTTVEIGGVKLASVDYSYSPNAGSKDLMAVSTENNTLEVLYFVANVEAEMRELEMVSGMAPTEVREYTFRETGKLLNARLVRFVLKYRPEHFFDLLPFDFWGSPHVPKDAMESLAREIADSIDNLTKAERAASEVDLFFKSVQEPTPLQKDMIEKILWRTSKFPSLLPEFYANVIKLRNRGLIFKSELFEYNKDGHAEGNLATKLEGALKSDLIVYLERVELAIQDLMEQRKGNLEAMVPPNSLALLRIIRASSSNPSLEKLILTFLADPHHNEILRKSFADKSILKVLANEGAHLNHRFVKKIVGILKGADIATRAEIELPRLTPRQSGVTCHGLL